MPKDERSNTFLAFVCDDATKEVVDSISLKHLGLEKEVHLGDSTQAIQHIQSNRTPKILLVDLSCVSQPISQIQKIAEVCEPGVEVLVIGDRNEVELFRSLLELGVADYIAKPLNVELLANSIERLLKQEDKPSEINRNFSTFGKTVSFIGARGGVGVSTLVANCAWVLATKHSKRVAVTDLDQQLGVISRLFDLNPGNGLRELLENPDRIDSVFVERSMIKKNDNLCILSSEEGLNEQLGGQIQGVQSFLKILKEQFHYTILDLPRNFTTNQNQSLFEASGLVVVVADMTLLSVRDTTRILKLINHHKSAAQRVLVVANRVGTYRHGEIEQADFEQSIQRKLDLMIPFDALTPLESLNMGEMVAEQDGKLSQGVAGLVDLLLGKEHITAANRSSSLINYFFTKKA